MTRRPVLAFGLGLILALAACGGDDASSIELTDFQVNRAFQNAVNLNGWIDVAPEVWGDLAVEACDREAWDHDVNAELASEFLSGNGWTDRAYADQLPFIIYLNLIIACHDLVPDGVTPPPGSMGASGGSPSDPTSAT